MMNREDVAALLERLIQNGEDEVVEFKEAKNDFNTDKIGQYFSALANEANLRKLRRAWLVFGVQDKGLVVGTNYRDNPERLQSTKHQIHQDTGPNTTFHDIYEHDDPRGRVIIFEIRAAPSGIPIAWKGHYYARAGERLVALSQDKQDEIRRQTIDLDWSAQIVPNATLEHLDQKAIQQAQESFAEKREKITVDEIRSWSLSTFLDRAQLTRDGKLTRTAILLLGKPEAAHLLNPHPAQITWKLEGAERAYEHFGPPFLLNTTELYRKIRNIQLRLLPENTLLPIEISKYDQKIVLEALHNCIAHQDYTLSGRIIVTEYPDKLTLENKGGFFEGEPEDYVTGEKIPQIYRNTFLIQAMEELNMIEKMGYGIYDMHRVQAQRYLPMPDYDLESSQEVKMTIYGGIVGIAYSLLLIQNTNLPMPEILALDRIQKGLPVKNAMVKQLRRKHLIEGRKPKYYVSASVAKTTTQKVEYIRTRAQDNDYYCKLITDYIGKFGRASRREIDALLMDKLSDALNDDQKIKKISNLLTTMRRKGQIENHGARKNPEWHLAKKD